MSYLNIDQEQRLTIEFGKIIGESVAILGIKGSGKTNTAAVVIEEMLANGLPLTIVDIEGEYWGLKEKFEIYVIGKSANVDVPVGASHAAYYAEFSIKNGVSLILDLSEFDQHETHDFLLEYFTALWQAAFKIRRPYQIVLEEAHEFVPQTVRTPLKEVLTRVALRGRKRGLGIISVSQRSAKVEKDILTQAGMVFLHRVVHPIDIKVYQDILPLPPREVEAGISTLKPGDAFVMVDNAVHRIHIRQRYTFHVGTTPQLEATKRPRLRNMNRELLLELKKLTQQTAMQRNISDDVGRIRQLEAAIKVRDEQIEALQRRIESLQSQIELLSKLQVSMTEKGPERETRKIASGVIERDRLATSNVMASDATPQPKPNMLDTTAPRAGDTSEQTAQEKRFAYLMTDIGKLPRFQRVALSFLTERADRTFTTSELARWLGISESTIENRPPLELVKMGLIKRGGARGRYTYSSAVNEQFARMFPALNSTLLIDRMLHQLKQG